MSEDEGKGQCYNMTYHASIQQAKSNYVLFIENQVSFCERFVFYLRYQVFNLFIPQSSSSLGICLEKLSKDAFNVFIFCKCSRSFCTSRILLCLTSTDQCYPQLAATAKEGGDKRLPLYQPLHFS